MFAMIEHTKIHYQVYGDGKPVVLLHGMGCDLRLMKGCLEPIFQKLPDYKRIYIDLPGMGKSDASLEFSCADGILHLLVSMINRLNLEHFLLIGESYGGYLARGILASPLASRVDGLLCICPVVIPKHISRKPAEKNIEFFDVPFLQQISPKQRAEFCEYAVVANPQTYERYQQEIEPGLQISNKEFLDELTRHYEFADDIDQKIRQSKFGKPTLFLTGRQDNSVGYEDLWKLMEDYPRATFAVLDCAGHNLQIEQPALFDCLVREWIMRAET